MAYKDKYDSGVKIRVGSIHKTAVGSSPVAKGDQSGSNDNYQGQSPFFNKKPLTKQGEHALGKKRKP